MNEHLCGLPIEDVALPGMRGDEAPPATLALRPDLPVIVSSGYTEAEVSRPFAQWLLEPILPAPGIAIAA